MTPTMAPAMMVVVAETAVNGGGYYWADAKQAAMAENDCSGDGCSKKCQSFGG